VTRLTRLEAWCCPRGHVYLHAHGACPDCGAALRPTRLSPHATLLLATTVRVSPSAAPFQLGLAITVCGRARTLCHVEGRVRGSGSDAVILERRNDTLVARPARTTRSRRE
jgi:uncharacterized OB-fold protein